MILIWFGVVYLLFNDGYNRHLQCKELKVVDKKFRKHKIVHYESCARCNSKYTVNEITHSEPCDCVYYGDYYDRSYKKNNKDSTIYE